MSSQRSTWQTKKITRRNISHEVQSRLTKTVAANSFLAVARLYRLEVSRRSTLFCWLLRTLIGLKLRFDNFKTVTRDQTIDAPTQDAALIRRAAGECLKRVPLDRHIRLLGVRVGALSRPGESPVVKPPTLFE